MAYDVQIQCINKIPRADPYYAITHVGGVSHDNTRWKLPLEDAIAGIKADKWRFWTVADHKPVWVKIGMSAKGHEYLRTETDGDLPNNLLRLPECP